MGVRDETRKLLLEGCSPGEIAKRMGVSLKTTLGYLDQMVGEGRLRRSDILLSIPASRRHKPSNIDDRLVVERYGSPAKLLGDIYEDVRFIEVTLHSLIRRILEDKFGKSEEGWWRQGVPESVRKSCVVRREEDSDPAADPYCYTDLIDTRQIIEKRWNLLQSELLRQVSDKRQLMDDLLRLNQIRRMVMHPVRRGVPSEDDFDFLRAFRRRLEAQSAGLNPS